MQDKWALYDLRWNPPGYDFLIFLQTALQAGCNAIRFKPGSPEDHGTAEDEQRKLRKIAFRICENFNLKYVVSEEKVGEEDFPFKSRNAHTFRYIKMWVKEPRPLMPSPEALARAAHVKGKIVVILRESSIQTHRNSSQHWRRWAADHEAMVLEDSQKTDMTPEDIAAHSELAKLTIGVWGGAMVPAMMSHRPFLIFKCLIDSENGLQSPKYWKKLGWEIGEQLPWSDYRQRIVWSDKDDYETIETEFQKWCDANPA